jgi:hypothetical protein
MLKGAETIEHKPNLLVEAMRPTLTAGVANDPQGILYRLAFDTLFTRMEWIGHRVRSGLITIEDIPDLEYWMKSLADWPYAAGKDAFLPFLKAFKYEATLRLMLDFQARKGDPVTV